MKPRMRSTKNLKKILKKLHPLRKSTAPSQDVIIEDHSETSEPKFNDSYGGESDALPTRCTGTDCNDTTSTVTNCEMAPSNTVSKWDETDLYDYPRKRESVLGKQTGKEEWDAVENEKVSDPSQKRNTENNEASQASYRIEDHIEISDIPKEGFRRKRRISLIRLGERTSKSKGSAVRGDEVSNEHASETRSVNETKRRTSFFGEDMDDVVWKMFGHDPDSDDFGSNERLRDKAERPKRSLSLFTKMEAGSLSGRQYGTRYNEGGSSEGGTRGRRRKSLFGLDEKHKRKEYNNTSGTSNSDGGTKGRRRISLFGLSGKHKRKQGNDLSETANKNCNGSYKKTFQEEIQQAVLELLQDDIESSSSDEDSLNRNRDDKKSLTKLSGTENKLETNNPSDSSPDDSSDSYYNSLDENFTQLDLEAADIMKAIRNEIFEDKERNIMVSNVNLKSDDEDDGMEDEISKLKSISIALREEIKEAQARLSELEISESFTTY